MRIALTCLLFLFTAGLFSALVAAEEKPKKPAPEVYTDPVFNFAMTKPGDAAEITVLSGAKLQEQVKNEVYRVQFFVGNPNDWDAVITVITGTLGQDSNYSKQMLAAQKQIEKDYKDFKIKPKIQNGPAKIGGAKSVPYQYIEFLGNSQEHASLALYGKIIGFARGTTMYYIQLTEKMGFHTADKKDEKANKLRNYINKIIFSFTFTK